MAAFSIADLLAEHPFFAGLDDKTLMVLQGCATNTHFRPGQFLFRQGEPADHFYVLRRGQVQLEVSSPNRGPLVLDSFGSDDVLGWTWLVPPYRWEADARATDQTHAIAFDGACLRDKCDADPALGYELLKRAAVVLNTRLLSALERLLDLYGPVLETGGGAYRDAAVRR